VKVALPLIVLAVLIGVFWISKDFVFPSGYWNYRMTVEVETPEGLKQGSAVRRISYHTEPSLFPGQGGALYYVSQGQAVVVDLGKRGLLFATMGQDYAHNVALQSFPLREKTPIGTKVTLAPERYPPLVHFRDLNDPRTIEHSYGHEMRDVPCAPVDHGTQPTHCRGPVFADHLEEQFGSGVKLKEISIEVTNDSVTTGIENWLPWLSQMRGYLSGEHTCHGTELFACMDTSAFYRGLHK